MSEEVLTKVVFDCVTQESVTLPLTEAEIAQIAIDRQEAQERRDAQIAAAEALETLKVSARAKLVAGQPLTEEEAAVLVI
jgi:hypothetical protein